MLLKFEGITRGGHGDRFLAATGGIEYTLYQLFGLDVEAGAEASEPHIWFTLSGPPGTKKLLDVELELMLDSSQRSR